MSDESQEANAVEVLAEKLAGQERGLPGGATEGQETMVPGPEPPKGPNGNYTVEQLSEMKGKPAVPGAVGGFVAEGDEQVAVVQTGDIAAALKLAKENRGHPENVPGPDRNKVRGTMLRHPSELTDPQAPVESREDITVTVSKDPEPDLVFSDDDQEVTIILRKGLHPVLTFTGPKWDGRDATNAIAALRRGFRQYQATVRGGSSRLITQATEGEDGQ